MRTADTKISSSAALLQKKTDQPFFNKKGQDQFFSTAGKSAQSFFTPPPVQTKLTIGQPNDKYEQEADAVADKVVQRLAAPELLSKKEIAVQAKPLTGSITPLVQAKCASCEQEDKLRKKEEEDTVQESPLELQRKPIFESNAETGDDETTIQRKCDRCEEEQVQKKDLGVNEKISLPIDNGAQIHRKALFVGPVGKSGGEEKEQEQVQRKPIFESANDAAEVVQRKEGALETSTSSSIESKLSSNNGNGTPLAPGINESMSTAFGSDFSAVRIHNDSAATELSNALNAQAFTYKNDIYFNSGKYDTGSAAGKHLLAHELTHTIQQSAGIHLKANPPQDKSGGILKNDPEIELQKESKKEAAFGTHVSFVPPPADENNKQNFSLPFNIAGNVQRAVVQRNSGTNLIQRQPTALKGAGPSTGFKTVFDTDVEMYSWPDLNQIGFSLYQAPWIQVRWKEGQGRNFPKVKFIKQDVPRLYRVEISADFDILVTIDGQAEARYSSLSPGATVFEHKYKAKGRKVVVNKHVISGVTLSSLEDTKGVPEDVEIRESYPGKAINVREFDPELGRQVPGPDDPGPMINSNYYPDFFWLFDTLEQLQAFVGAWRSWNWIEYPAAGKKFMAYALGEKAMQQFAAHTREQPVPNFTRMYIDGTMMDPWSLLDLFYAADWEARYGNFGDTKDCFVFRHGKESFGRESLEHAHAMAYWSWFDSRSVAEMEQRLVKGFPFYSLNAVGSSGSLREIGLDYFKARDELFVSVYKKRGKDDDSWVPYSSSFGWGEVLTNDLWARYLDAAVDRPESYIDDFLKRVLEENPGLVEEAGQRILKDVEFEAKLEGEAAIRGAIDGLKIYATEESAQRLVQKIPFMKEYEQNDTLEFIGIEMDDRPKWKEVLSDPAQAALVWMGEDIKEVSTDKVLKKITEQVDGLRELLSKIKSDEISPLFMEGGFGVGIRERVYKKFGFGLNPVNFPHEEDAKWRSQNKGWTGHYGAESAYLFAQATAADARRKRYLKYLKIFALVLASVILVLVANAAGAALAGLMFSTATTAGLIAFSVAEVAIAAGIVTLVGPAMNTFIMSGGTATSEDYKNAYKNLGTQYVINLATFGFFKVLGAATRAIAVSGAGGKQAFQASRAWQAADTGMRIGTSAGAFFGIAVLSKYIESGKVPEGEEMNELLFETALSVVLLEVGAYATRGPMQSLNKWAKAQRLGEFGPKMEKLLLEAHSMRVEVAEFAVRPNAASEKGPQLVELQKDLLQRQRDLVKEMSEKFKTRPDAQQLEKELNRINEEFDLLIQQLKDVEFFAKANIRPSGRASFEEPSFTYERGQEEEIKKYYGEENVKKIAEGVFEVMSNGRKLSFRPATELDPTLLPDGTRRAATLDTWKSVLAERQLKIIEQAYKLAESSTELKKIEKSDPSKMNDKELNKFEALLNSAELKLEKIASKKISGFDKTEYVPGEPTEDWRLRLNAIRENLILRAELLGSEYLVDHIKKKLRTYRPNLSKDTLARHAEILEKARIEIEKAWNAKFEQAKVSQNLQPQKEVAVLRAEIIARQEALRDRVRFHGSKDAKYMKEALKNIGSTEKLSSLREIEASIEKAEARFDKAAQEALKTGTEKFGKETIDEARKGELAGLSDQQVGDVLKMLKGAKGLTPAALKGALYASLPPPKGSTASSLIPLENAVAFSGGRTAELNFVLESFLVMREAGIEGTYKLLRDATSSSGKWKGSLWQLEVVRLVIGTEKVSAVEVKVPGREIDIVLTDGRRIETKDWEILYKDKVREQFTQDLEHTTDGGKNADKLKEIQWMFRSPAPDSIIKIRSLMESALDTFIEGKLKEGKITTAEAKQLKEAFKNHLELVQVPKIDRTQVVTDMPGVSNPTLLPPIKRKDEEK